MNTGNESATSLPTENDISILVVEVAEHLKKKTKKTFFAQILNKDRFEPFWQIAKDKKMRNLICIISHSPVKKELTFKCTLENITPTTYDTFREKLNELAKEKGLTINELNPA